MSTQIRVALAADEDSSTLPTHPQEFLQHFQDLFKQIPAGATNPLIEFDPHQTVYDVSYWREESLQEAQDRLEAGSLSMLSNMRDAARAEGEERAELDRLQAKYSRSGSKDITLLDGTEALIRDSRYYVANSETNRTKILRQYDGSYLLPSEAIQLLPVLLIDIERVFGGAE